MIAEAQTYPLRANLLLFALLVALPACDSAPISKPACDPNVLFGRPNDKTGLTAEQCKPECTCQQEPFLAPEYTQTDIDALAQWQLLDTLTPLAADPYAAPAPPEGTKDEVCAVLADPPGSHSYHLITYPSEQAAKDASAIATHFGACGLCSPLTDLAVYMRETDLTTPVRDCGVKHLQGPMDAHIACLQALGFDYPCAQIWYYNTINTRKACELPCFSTLGKPYQNEDGTLNECLQCDEDLSGPIFKAVAGRTRRNTGIASALCRPCSEVRPLLHAYP